MVSDPKMRKKDIKDRESASKENDSSVTSVLRGLGNILSTLISVAVVVLVIALLAVRVAGFKLYTIESGSMEPSYPVNSLVVVKQAEFEDIEIGDVITYKMSSAGVTVTHRVTEINEDNESFTTKGDANAQEDAAPVQYEDVVGVVIFDIPKLGVAVSFITERKIVFIVFIILLLAVSIVWDTVTGRKMKKAAAGPADLPDSADKGEWSVDSGDDGEVDD